MSARRRKSGPLQQVLRPEVIAVVVAAAAAFAPANLTGNPAIDAVERAVIAGFVAFVGCHGRRWAWLAGAALVVLPAREVSLLIALAGLVVVVIAAVPEHRNRAVGAAGLGLAVNAAFWYPEGTPAWGVAVAVLAQLVVVLSSIQYLRRPKRRAAWSLLLGATAIALLAGVGALVAVGLSYRNVQQGSSAARGALESARSGNAEAASDDLTTARTEFGAANDRVNGLLTVPAQLVPGLAQQVSAVQVTVEQGKAIASTADDLVATADYDRLQYDGRLDLAQVGALAEPTARADATLATAQDRLGEIRGDSLVPPLRDRLQQFQDDIDEARADTSLAAALLDATPTLFGADGPRRYLVVFLTPAELRGAGGFVGSYAELTIDDGKATLTRSGRIDDLIEGPNRKNRTLDGPADYLKRYGRFDPADFPQDATYSPHFPSDASVLAQIYPQAGGQPVDGVIAVDPKGLAALLELTGPVTVPGFDEPLTAANAADLLTRRQYLELGDRAARGEFLADATKATFEQLVNSSLPSPRKLATTLSPAARGGHIRLWSPDADEQDLFERLGADGSLVIPKGSDGFSVIQQNAGNNKIDAYLQRKIDYEPTVDAITGELRAELTIEMTNTLPQGDLPGAVAGNTRGAPPGTNVTTLTLYTRNVVTRATIDGVPLTLGPGTERGLNAWDTPQFNIDPGATVTLKIELEGGVDLADGYRLTILPQPVANPDVFSSTVRVTNGTVGGSERNQKQVLDDEPLEAPTRIRVPVER